MFCESKYVPQPVGLAKVTVTTKAPAYSEAWWALVFLSYPTNPVCWKMGWSKNGGVKTNHLAVEMMGKKWETYPFVYLG